MVSSGWDSGVRSCQPTKYLFLFTERDTPADACPPRPWLAGHTVRHLSPSPFPISLFFVSSFFCLLLSAPSFYLLNKPAQVPPHRVPQTLPSFRNEFSTWSLPLRKLQSGEILRVAQTSDKLMVFLVSELSPHASPSAAAHARTCAHAPRRGGNPNFWVPAPGLDLPSLCQLCLPWLHTQRCPGTNAFTPSANSCYG